MLSNLKGLLRDLSKFMLSNPADLKRLDALSGISFSKYVKGKIDCDAAGVDIVLLQEQVTRLEQEIRELKRCEIKSSSPVRPVREEKTRVDIDNWFEE